MKITGRELEKNSIIVFSVTMISNIMNYMFQVAMVRMLDVEVFGLMNVLFSFITILSFPITVISLVVSKLVIEYGAGVINKAYIFIVCVMCCFLAAGILAREGLSGFINVNEIYLVVFSIVISGMQMVLFVAMGGLQGRKKFYALSLVIVVPSVFRFFGSIVFINLGWGLLGVLFSFFLGIIIAILTGVILLRDTAEQTVELIEIDKSKIIRYVGVVFFVNMGITLMTNMDNIIVNRYFSDTELGVYSVAGMLVKLIFFLSNTFTWVLFPYVVDAVNNIDSTIRLLKKAMFYGAGLSVTAAVFLIVLSRPVIEVLFGVQYIESIHYIFSLTLWIVPLSILVILSNYLLAINKANFLACSIIIGCILSFVFASLFNYEISQIINVFAVVSSFLLVVNVAVLCFIVKNQKKTVI